MHIDPFKQHRRFILINRIKVDIKDWLDLITLGGDKHIRRISIHPDPAWLLRSCHRSCHFATISIVYDHIIFDNMSTISTKINRCSHVDIYIFRPLVCSVYPCSAQLRIPTFFLKFVV